MATLHATPNPATWQFLPITFLQSYRSLARARKNAKKVVEGLDADADNTTDYDKPRKRRVPQKFVDSSDEEVPSTKKRGKKKKVSSDSDSEPDREIPSPNTDLDGLQAKVDRALALRQVNKPPRDVKNTKTVVRVTQKPLSVNVIKKGSSQSSSCSQNSISINSTKSIPIPNKTATTKQPTNFKPGLKSSTTMNMSEGSIYSSPRFQSCIGIANATSLNFKRSQTSLNRGKLTIDTDPKCSQISATITTPMEADDKGDDSGFLEMHQPGSPTHLDIGDNGSEILVQDNSINADGTSSEHTGTSVNSANTGNEGSSSNVVKTVDTGVQTVADKIPTSSSHQFQLYQQGEQLTRLMKQVLTNQQRILSYVVPESEQSRRDFQDLPELPLTSEDDFEDFEQYLDLKPQKQLFVKYLISLYKEGMDEGKFVTKLLPQLINNSLSKCISWEGTEGTKLRFGNSKMNNAIRLAVLKLFQSSDLNKAESKIQRWFNTSAQRH